MNKFIFTVVLMVSAIGGFAAAQGMRGTGGGGMAGQPIDGTAISPSSVSASTYDSTAASGSQAYTCANVGCRLSLGSTGRYLVDDGTSLEFVAPVQGTSFEALATSGSSFVGGNATGNLTITSNATDAVTSSTVPAIRLQSSQDITNSDLIFAVEDFAGNRKLSVAEDGSLTVAAIINATGQVITASQFQTTFGAFTATNVAATLQSNIGSGGTSLILRTTGTLNTDAARLVEFRNASTTAVAHMSKDGLLRVNQANAARPTCNADNRGRLFFLDGAAGVADTMEVCMKDSADNYDWETVASP